MKMIIDVAEDIYKRCLVYKDLPIEPNGANDLSELTYAVGNGIPLSEEESEE